MIVRILGKTTVMHINNICTYEYHCASNEFEISANLAENAFVNVLHLRPIDGTVISTISTDNMSVSATFIPPINNGLVPSYDELFRKIFSRDAVPPKFADQQAFKDAYEQMKKGFMVCNVLVGTGIQPVHGENAKLQIFFELPSEKHIAYGEGQVNYRESKRYINTRMDQLLARVIPETQGTPGETITGNPIPQIPGKKVDLEPAHGVRTNEMRTEYYADTDGYITYSKNILSVSPVIEVKKDVDHSIGNIDFVGSVEIKGDVLPGFSVKAKNITVGGICQDASLTAENDILIRVGVKGNNDIHSISAGGNIELGYCENAKISAKGNIIINKYSFNCHLNTGNRIIADKRTTITGGKITCFAGGSFYNLGTKANTNIEIMVGKKYDSEEKLTRIKEEKIRLMESVEKINDVLGPLNLQEAKNLINPKIKKLMETRELITKRIALFERRIKSLAEESSCAYPYIDVLHEIQDGVMLKFFETPYMVRTTQKKVRFSFDPMNLEVTYQKLEG